MSKSSGKLPWWYKMAPLVCQGGSWHIGKALIVIINDLRITGRENLKEAKRLRKKYKTGIIFATNHTGELDPLLVLTAISPFSSLFPMFYLSEDGKYYKKGKAFGWRGFFYGRLLFYLWGAHPIKSTDGTYKPLHTHGEYHNELETHKMLLEKRCSVCIFPEGEIPQVAPTDLGKLNGGLGFLADVADGNTIIVPVAIKRESGKYNRQIVKVHYGEPLTYNEHITRYKKEYENEDSPHHKISERIMKRVKHYLAEL